jgi:UDP-N-acetylglucosamine--N-acetylmuramyl-(pentapeptide) pyrophosphoryl-undecaprenol N-acetylglucosamine transferase
MEAQLVPAKGYTMAWVNMSGVRGKGVLRIVLLPLQLLVAFWQCLRAIFAHRPDVVLGLGGYVSFPGGMMAALLGVPLVIHEQNSIAGLANRVLAKVADRVLAGFPEAFSTTTVIWTGNPVRADIAALVSPDHRYRARSGPLRLTVIGGSLGAQALNEVVPQALALLAPHERPQVTHQSGARHLAQVEANYRQAAVTATLLPFIDDMPRCYAESDLIICRAGASTIAELAAAGVASILVPFPHAVDDHQTHNARFLSSRGAAVLMPQTELTPHKLAEVLRGFTRDALLQMALQARAVGKPDATQMVAQVCMGLAA